MDSAFVGTITDAGILAAGITLGMIAAFVIGWYILMIIGDWKIFTKAGKPGWHSIIPFLNYYDEYDLCWSGSVGLLFCISTIVSSAITYLVKTPSLLLSMVSMVFVVIGFVLHLIESWKLSKAFGKGAGFFIFLLLFDRIARVVLGLGSSEYQGRQ